MKRIMVFVLAALFCLTSCAENPTGEKGEDSPPKDEATNTAPEGGEEYEPFMPEDLKAVWLSQWDMRRVYLKNGKQREESDFAARATQIMQDAKEDGFNAVFIQVRPFGDSFYPSEFYPPSAMVVGTYGADFSYDPFAYLVDAAHATGLSVHAWINPLRLMSTEELEQVPKQYQIRKWYDDPNTRGRYLVLQTDGRWYLNPGYREVCDLIVAGAKEAVEQYHVDGLHIDDYFYPTIDESYDRECFLQYTDAGGEMNLGDFRRSAISALVKDLCGAVHSARAGAVFGVAPGGNADRAYSSQYADVFLWCSEEGYLDYICPEIYFGFEHETYPFEKTAKRWSAMVTCESVKLYVGLSFHKASSGFDQYAGSGAYEWAKNSDILYRSLAFAAELENCGGVAVFSYQYFRNALTGEVPDFPREEREAFLPLLKTVTFLG